MSHSARTITAIESLRIGTDAMSTRKPALDVYLQLTGSRLAA